MRLVSNALQNLAVVCGLGLTIASVLSTAAAKAGSELVLHSFQGGADGARPFGTLIADDSGNIYGTSTAGGGGTGCGGDLGCGTIFRIGPDGSETVLYAFAGGCDGEAPVYGLLEDKSGNLYGTTDQGGKCKGWGYGTVFKLAPDGTKTMLHAFRGNDDGYGPAGALIADKKGNLYGTTSYGGNYNGTHCGDGCGTVFRIAPDGKKATLYFFQGDRNGGTDGWHPSGSLVADNEGNLYGETWFGGDGCPAYSGGCGTVFQLAPDGTEKVIYAFKAGTDGYTPIGGLARDRSGNFYGVTEWGGSGLTNCEPNGCGTIFKLAPDGTETVLYNFQGGDDGKFPASAPVIDRNGNLFGTTLIGGGDKCRHLLGSGGCGTVFRLSPNGTESIIDNFEPKNQLGKEPFGGLLLGKDGLLYGTTVSGGSKLQDGLVFSLSTK